MISELLNITINEVGYSNLEISEFQLGKIPYSMLIEECKSTIAGFNVDINKINKFAGINVSLHESDDAIMYCLKFKK